MPRALNPRQVVMLLAGLSTLAILAVWGSVYDGQGNAADNNDDNNNNNERSGLPSDPNARGRDRADVFKGLVDRRLQPPPPHVHDAKPQPRTAPDPVPHPPPPGQPAWLAEATPRLAARHVDLGAEALQETCGAWVHSYAAFHRSAMARLRADPLTQELPKVVVYRCRKEWDCGGLADSICGIVGVFMHALLEHKVFLVDWPELAAAFSTRLNLTYDEALLGLPAANRTVVFHDVINCDLRKGRPTPCPLPLFGRSTDFDEDVAVLRNNRAMTLRATRNPHYQPIFAGLGLNVTSSFGCLMQFLFRPRPEVWELVRNETLVLLDPAHVNIGIHIRYGDKFMGNNSQKKLKWDSVQGYIDGAARAETLLTKAWAGAGAAPRPFRWLVVTDNKAIKDRFQALFPAKAVVTDMTPSHIDLAWTQGDIAPEFSLLSTVAEWLLYSLCDYMILNGKSGYSRTAAFYGFHAGPVTMRPADKRWVRLESYTGGSHF